MAFARGALPIMLSSIFIDEIEAIKSNMDRRLFTCGIFIDLKKAFDTVNHKILLDKFSNHYGFRGIINDWFESHLTDRIPHLG